MQFLKKMRNFFSDAFFFSVEMFFGANLKKNPTLQKTVTPVGGFRVWPVAGWGLVRVGSGPGFGTIPCRPPLFPPKKNWGADHHSLAHPLWHGDFLVPSW